MQTLADSCTLESFLARCSGCSADIDAQGLLLRPSLLPFPPGASAAAASEAAPPAPAQAGDPEAAPDAPAPAEAGVFPAASKPTAPTQAGKPRAAPEPPAPLLVWRATPDGCSVKGGTVRVGDGAVLLLDGKGASFEGTHSQVRLLLPPASPRCLCLALSRLPPSPPLKVTALLLCYNSIQQLDYLLPLTSLMGQTMCAVAFTHGDMYT